MGLRDSRDGHGFQATWPSKLGVFGIPIDHVLVDPKTRVIRREVLRGQSASDHSAVKLDLQLAD